MTLLAILANLHRTIVSVFLLISFPQSLFHAFGDHSKCTHYSWYHSHFQVPRVFPFSSKIRAFVYFKNFSLYGSNTKIKNQMKLSNIFISAKVYLPACERRNQPLSVPSRPPYICEFSEINELSVHTI